MKDVTWAQCTANSIIK